MKFSWKVFAVTYIGMLVSLSLAGAVLVASSFYRMLEGEQSNVQREHVLLNQAVSSALDSYELDFYTSEESLTQSIFADLVRSQTPKCGIRVGKTTNKILFENDQYLKIQGKYKWLRKEKSKHENEEIARSICTNDGNYYIQQSSLFYVAGQRYQLETFHNISSLFRMRERQTQLLILVMMIAGSAGSVIILTGTRKLTKPISMLSKKTASVAKGQLSERMDYSSGDEVGELVTNFNLMAKNLEKNFREIEDAAYRQKQFVGNFTHEIKTPLTTMIGHADLLRSKVMTEEQIFASSSFIFSEGKRLESLSRKLLMLAFENDEELERKPVEMKMFLTQLCTPLYADERYEQIKFDLKIEKNIIPIDKDLMQTVILNLIDNARKSFTVMSEEKESKKIGKPPTKRNQIVVSGYKQENQYFICIKDNGIGIPEEDLRHIMEPFYMVDRSRSRELGGSGLGLALCNKIVEKHHGKITFKSKLTMGTQVSVCLEVLT